ncbi:MAG TPA: DUF4177 domain-containing protein [Anaerolineae bacterium]|nr:DUF4177 domain-containing protein [Anaerolineae bacterium]
MYEYEFVKINASTSFFTNTEPADDYQEIVRNYAANGWRFVQMITPSISSNRAQPTHYELVFERPLP